MVDPKRASAYERPLYPDGRVIAVLDVDSGSLASFDDDDVEPLGRISV
ncbi:MAG: hypothetical protein ABIJ86_07270 [Spirochaetota bacterium]